MGYKTKSLLTGVLIIIFSFVLPVFIVFTTYATVKSPETTNITVNFIGIIIILLLTLGLFKWFKKRIRNKIDSGLHVSPYWVLFINNTMSLVLLILFGWFVWTIKDDIEIFSNLMIVIIICELISYGLKYLQTRFDILYKKELENK